MEKRITELNNRIQSYKEKVSRYQKVIEPQNKWLIKNLLLKIIRTIFKQLKYQINWQQVFYSLSFS